MRSAIVDVVTAPPSRCNLIARKLPLAPVAAMSGSTAILAYPPVLDPVRLEPSTNVPYHSRCPPTSFGVVVLLASVRLRQPSFRRRPEPSEAGGGEVPPKLTPSIMRVPPPSDRGKSGLESETLGHGLLSTVERYEGHLGRLRGDVERRRDVPQVGASQVARVQDRRDLGR